MLLLSLGKATWSGCGAHVPSVMDGIPEKERCSVCPLMAFILFSSPSPESISPVRVLAGRKREAQADGSSANRRSKEEARNIRRRG